MQADEGSSTKGESGGTTKRVVLTPTQETLWADLSLLHEESGENWSSDVMLDVESKILVRHATLFYLIEAVVHAC